MHGLSPSFLLLALVTSRSCAEALPPTSKGVVLFDFESPAQLKQWRVRELTGLRVTRRWHTRGRSAAAVTFHRWTPGKEQWPAVIALNGALPVTDFSRFDALRFEAYNPQRKPVVLRLHLRDARQHRFSLTVDLPPRVTKPVVVPVRSFSSALDVRHMAELHFFVTQPASTYTVFVDAVRLTVDLPEETAKLLGALRRTAKEAKRLLRRAGEAASPALRKQVSDLCTLTGRVQNRLLRWRKTGFAGWEEVDRARAELHRFAARKTRLAAVVPRLRAAAYAARTGGDGFVLAVESSMKKVFLEAGRFDSPFAATARLSLARNEWESCQVVAVPFAGPLTNVRWALSPLTGPHGATLSATVRLVGYVDCKQPSYKVPHTGWWPDPLLDFQQSVPRVPVEEVLPLWVTVRAAAATPSGTYRGKLTVFAANRTPQSVTLVVHVWDFTLPAHTSLRTALSWRGLSPKLYPAARISALTRVYEDWLLTRYHLNPNNIYSGPPTWDAKRLRELVAEGLNALNLAYFNAPRGDKFDAAAYWKTFARKVKQIQAYLPVVEAAGARDLCFIYCFDERPSNQLDVVFETAARLKKLWPDIEVMTTATDPTFGMNRRHGEAVDIWVPLTPHFDGNAARLAAARKAGRDLWWYICIGPQHPYANWFVEYPALEARLLMGAMTAKYRPGGFLYYAVNRWPQNDRVITGGPRTDWNPASYRNNNGDGSILCAGPAGPLATIRLENIRDGIEDYEYYRLLRRLLAQARADRKAGEVSPAVVKNLTTFTHDPAVLRAERRRVAQAILKLTQGR